VDYLDFAKQRSATTWLVSVFLLSSMAIGRFRQFAYYGPVDQGGQR